MLRKRVGKKGTEGSGKKMMTNWLVSLVKNNILYVIYDILGLWQEFQRG